MSATKPNQNMVPPHDEAIERAILGALLSLEDAPFIVMPIIRNPQVFYIDANVQIFQAILKLQTENRKIDILVVSNALKLAGKLESIGGAYYLSTLVDGVYNTATLDHQCLIVVGLYIKRQLISTGREVTGMGADPQQEPHTAYQEAQQRLDAIGEQINTEPAREWLTILKDVTFDIERLSDGSQIGTGIRTGFDKLDGITGGWQPGQFIIMAARPGMGKTAMAVKHVCDVARQLVPVGVFELEMRDVDFGKRVIANESNLHANMLFVHGLNHGEKDYWPGYWKVISQIEPWPMHIKTRPGLTIYDFQIEARKMVQRNGVKLIVIDYMQLLRMGKDARTINNREQEISFISRTIKQTALELNVPIIALSQLSREVEKRSDKRPRLSDLRESGSLEQDADMVLFIHRDDYYSEVTDGLATYIIEKHRNGQTGTIDIGFDCNRVKFYDLNNNQLASANPEQPF